MCHSWLLPEASRYVVHRAMAVWDAGVFTKHSTAAERCKQLQLPWRTEALQSDQCGHASKTLIKKFLFPFSPSCLGPSDVRCSHELSILLSVGNTQKQKAGSLLGTLGSFCPWSKGAGCKSTLLPQYSALAMPCCISLSTCPSGEQPLAPFPP